LLDGFVTSIRPVLPFAQGRLHVRRRLQRADRTRRFVRSGIEKVLS
jgi:hypothetical protein